MKRIFVLALLLLSLQQYASAQLNITPYDTIYSRHDRYYYNDWYDTCHFYLNDSSTLLSCGGIHFFTTDTDESLHINKVFTSHPIAVKGLAAMVMTPAHMFANRYGSLTSENLPEYLMLLQPMDTGLLVLESPMRWDTVAPRLMILPLNHFDSSKVAYCHVHETFFKFPVYVDSVFYIGGTDRSLAPVWYDEYQDMMNKYVQIHYVTLMQLSDLTHQDFCRCTWPTM